MDNAVRINFPLKYARISRDKETTMTLHKPYLNVTDSAAYFVPFIDGKLVIYNSNFKDQLGENAIWCTGESTSVFCSLLITANGDVIITDSENAIHYKIQPIENALEKYILLTDKSIA